MTGALVALLMALMAMIGAISAYVMFTGWGRG